MKGKTIRIVSALLASAFLGTSCGPSGGAGHDPAEPVETWSKADGELADQGIQPRGAVESSAELRVQRAMLGPELELENEKALVPNPKSMQGTPLERVNDLVTDACRKPSGRDAYLSKFGRRREWKHPEARIEQFAGAWGVLTARDAVEQSRKWLTCSSYRNRDGLHRLLGLVPLPVFDEIDQRLMFCEVIEENAPGKTMYLCTVLLARGDIVSRFMVWVQGRAQAELYARALAETGAQALART